MPHHHSSKPTPFRSALRTSPTTSVSAGPTLRTVREASHTGRVASVIVGSQVTSLMDALFKHDMEMQDVRSRPEGRSRLIMRNTVVVNKNIQTRVARRSIGVAPFVLPVILYDSTIQYWKSPVGPRRHHVTTNRSTVTSSRHIRSISTASRSSPQGRHLASCPTANRWRLCRRGKVRGATHDNNKRHRHWS